MGTTEEIKIKKVHTFLDLAIASIVLAAGIGLYFLLPGWGILFCFIGVLLFVFYKRADKRVGEATLLKEKTLDIDPEYRSGIIDFFEQKTDTLDFATTSEADHLYLEVYFNAEKPVAYVRLYDVAENRFDAATEIMELRGTSAEKLISKL
jgi:hypothetical protein